MQFCGSLHVYDTGNCMAQLLVNCVSSAGHSGLQGVDAYPTGRHSTGLHQFLRHLTGVSEQIGRPPLVITVPYPQCKDSSLSTESFMAGIAGGSSLAEREELQSRVSAELDRLKQVGVTGKLGCAVCTCIDRCASAQHLTNRRWPLW